MLQVISEHGPAMDSATFKAMTYAEAVVKETLRLHPVVGAVFRRSLKDFSLGGFHIPKACTPW
jgi:cytochrome P450